MTKEEFVKVFNTVATAHSFEYAFSGWFKYSKECILVLALQKSNFGSYYDLNIKIFVQGIMGRKYEISKDLVKKDIGDIFIRQPLNYKDFFNLDLLPDKQTTETKLNIFFSDFIDSFTISALSREGIKNLFSQKKIFLLPAIKNELFIHE